MQTFLFLCRSPNNAAFHWPLCPPNFLFIRACALNTFHVIFHVGDGAYIACDDIAACGRTILLHVCLVAAVCVKIKDLVNEGGVCATPPPQQPLGGAATVGAATLLISALLRPVAGGAAMLLPRVTAAVAAAHRHLRHRCCLHRCRLHCCRLHYRCRLGRRALPHGAAFAACCRFRHLCCLCCCCFRLRRSPPPAVVQVNMWYQVFHVTVRVKQ